MAVVWSDEKDAALYRSCRFEFPSFLIDSILDYYRDYFQEKERIPFALDVACGSGQVAFPLMRICDRVMGIDISKAHIDEAKKAACAEGISTDRLSFKVGSAHDFSELCDTKADLVTIGAALHLLDEEKFFKEVHTILRPGGIVEISDWSISGFPGNDGTLFEQYQQFFSILESKLTNTTTIETDPNKKSKFRDLETYYRTLKIPFEGVRVKEDTIEIDFSRDNLENYFCTLSTFIRYRHLDPEGARTLRSEFFQKFWTLAGNQSNSVRTEILRISVLGRKI